jgi:hypothetical protein
MTFGPWAPLLSWLFCKVGCARAAAQAEPASFSLQRQQWVPIILNVACPFCDGRGGAKLPKMEKAQELRNNAIFYARMIMGY